MSSVEPVQRLFSRVLAVAPLDVASSAASVVPTDAQARIDLAERLLEADHDADVEALLSPLTHLAAWRLFEAAPTERVARMVTARCVDPHSLVRHMLAFDGQRAAESWFIVAAAAPLLSQTPHVLVDAVDQLLEGPPCDGIVDAVASAVVGSLRVWAHRTADDPATRPTSVAEALVSFARFEAAAQLFAAYGTPEERRVVWPFVELPRSPRVVAHRCVLAACELLDELNAPHSATRAALGLDVSVVAQQVASVLERNPSLVALRPVAQAACRGAGVELPKECVLPDDFVEWMDAVCAADPVVLEDRVTRLSSTADAGVRAVYAKLLASNPALSNDAAFELVCAPRGVAEAAGRGLVELGRRLEWEGVGSQHLRALLMVAHPASVLPCVVDPHRLAALWFNALCESGTSASEAQVLFERAGFWESIDVGGLRVCDTLELIAKPFSPSIPAFTNSDWARARPVLAYVQRQATDPTRTRLFAELLVDQRATFDEVSDMVDAAMSSS